MDFHFHLSFQISKISKKINLLAQRLDNICPKLSINKLKDTNSCISSNLNVTSTLESNNGKVYSLSWAGYGSSRNPEGSLMLASVTDQGELTIWNTQKLRPIFRANVISDDPWLMTCAFEHRESALLATGGIEGKLHIFMLNKTSSHELILSEHPQITLKAHESYISKCEFLTSIEIVTVSGDSLCKIWSLQPNREALRVLKGHTDDIMSLGTTSQNSSIFITGGCDSTIRVWDIRDSKGNVCTYYTHIGHINAIKFIKDSDNTFASGSSNGISRIHDLRTLREIGTYANYRDLKSMSDISFSNSGRLLITADEIGRINVWDVFDERVPIQTLSLYVDKITSMEISHDGKTIAASSFDGIAFLQNLSDGNF